LPVGNDVVDLRDGETRPGAVHPRFDLRVFTSEERALIAAARLPERLRWRLWAAKESAFKAARKLDAGLPFHPRRFAVRLLEDTRAEVTHRVAGPFHVWLEEARDWIHAVAAHAGEARSRPPSAVEVLGGDEASPARLGERARELARRTIAPLLSVDSEHLAVVLHDRIPHLSREGSILPVDLSLSHHARVVACASAGTD
jgi:phosphopantetheinyl transferase (holo-ACP synthase)